MARRGITYNEVATAAENLVADGENPTILRVRGMLGTGSPNTIHRHLTAWRDSKPEKETKAPELPIDLQTAIVKELDRQSAEARAEAEGQLSQARAEAAELAATGEKLEAEMVELTDQNQVLSDKCIRLGALAEERGQEITKLRADLVREQEEVAGLRVELAQQLARNTSQAEQIDTLTARVQKGKSDLEMEAAAKIAAEQRAAVIEVKHEAADQKVQGLTRELIEQKEDLKQQLVSQRTNHEQQLSDFRERLAEQKADLKKQLKDQKDVAEQRLAEVRKDHQQRIEELKKELDAKTEAAAQARTMVSELKGKLEGMGKNTE